jgi:hypothetical protein
MDFIMVVISSIALGAWCVIPGLLIGNSLRKKGLAWSGPWVHILTTIVCAIGIRLQFPKATLTFILIVLPLLSISIYMNELWLSTRKGRWWWKSENRNRHS